MLHVRHPYFISIIQVLCHCNLFVIQELIISIYGTRKVAIKSYKSYEQNNLGNKLVKVF